jgi:hypothetical protein
MLKHSQIIYKLLTILLGTYCSLPCHVRTFRFYNLEYAEIVYGVDDLKKWIVATDK